MKIALICDSLLLDRSLEMYLKEHLTSYKLCDFVVATQFVESQKPVFLIGDFEGAHLKIPFTREILFQELETFDRKVRTKSKESKNYSESQETNLIPATNVAGVGFDNFDSLPTTSSPIFNAESQPNPQISSPIARDSSLHTKIEEVLHRYAKEIETIVLEHYRDKNA